MQCADDANIYVRSRRAGERVLAAVERFLNQRLKLTLNREKSRLARHWACDDLGYGMSWHKQPKLRVASMSLNRLRDRLKALLHGARGHKMANVIERINRALRGWAGYFKLSQSRQPLDIYRSAFIHSIGLSTVKTLHQVSADVPPIAATRRGALTKTRNTAEAVVNGATVT